MQRGTEQLGGEQLAADDPAAASHPQHRILHTTDPNTVFFARFSCGSGSGHQKQNGSITQPFDTKLGLELCSSCRHEGR